jgi:thiol:disulfide interchange protein DsbD
MRCSKWCLLGLLWVSPAVLALSGSVVETANVKARLISESDAIAPGRSVWVALELDIRDGWHTYWRNPGDSGQATRLDWTLPPGLSAGEIVWTTPHRFEVASLVNYGYARHAMHLVKITAAADLKSAAPLDLAAKASWLVCADVCIPESAKLDLELPAKAAGGGVDAALAPLFAEARADLPKTPPAPVIAKIERGQLVLTLGKDWGASLATIHSLAFYPFDDGAIEYATPQTLTRHDGVVDLAMKLGYQPPQSERVGGVLLATEGSGSGALTVPLEIAAQLSPVGSAAVQPTQLASHTDSKQAASTQSAATPLASTHTDSTPLTSTHTDSTPLASTQADSTRNAPTPLTSTQSDSAQSASMQLSSTHTASTQTASAPAVAGTAPRFPAGAARSAAGRDTPALPVLVLLAILGGLVLNLMPCVFPVLSIKAIGLVEQAKKHPAAVRAKGFVFAAGVIASMLCLAGALLALRAGGEEIGWGFQLQSPLFVTLMIYLLLGVGLNLSGVFEFGGGLAGVGDSLTRGDGYRASFFTGVLTTLVATPCTAPFMAAAVGAALTQSPLVALGIFAALGAGLALPYLLLSVAPWMRRALPKPGAWMDTLKQVFAFPMYASAAWLLWVLAQQTSSLGLGAALAGAILIGLAAWSYQKSKGVSSGGRTAALLTSAAAVVLALALPLRFAQVANASPATSAASGDPREPDAWQPYDAARVQELNARGVPLLVNFTASWCLTCLVNERNAFADAAVQQVFRGKGVTLMKGDWTNRDPAITKALADFGRAGVPLYVVYNSRPGSAAPVVLPQLLTAGIVESTFAGLPDRDSK